MRPIDADAEFLVTVNYGGGLSECYRTTVAEYLGENMNKIPTIDAVPVVRCGQCKHGSKCLLGVVQCKMYGYKHQADWFCAGGEQE